MANLANMTFVADFDLLREGRINIRDQPWAQPGGPAQQAMDLQLKRSDEEINRLHNEIQRFWTWMYDESQFLERYEAHLSQVDNNPSLAYHVYLQRIEREHFDEVHRRRLRKLIGHGLPPSAVQLGVSVDCTQHAPPVTRPACQPPPPTAEEDLDGEDGLQDTGPPTCLAHKTL
ncbi:hypothetical protein MIND_01150100 [Mycena indigotica]|uniref:Uncharacterized protein n=1 Tax=Mycena indigotica TaxID=2126181 RepID=A0A8H6S7N9_9AGAR|nr:uncharacterized protein MIND_01150100 [Mycena indigotica]KAF7293700.1 hypothetical protein MIND_01150100 [Mycena indigotica]